MWSLLWMVCLARLALAAEPMDLGLFCANAVCAGNATCLIRTSNGEPICAGRTKTGACPPSNSQGCNEIEMMCMSDSDCPGQRICCQEGCTRVCKAAGEDEPKPGHCPSRFAFGPCVHECGLDGECPGSTKCCSTGCGKICSSPYVAKPGSCPVPSFEGGNCQNSCSIDDECPGDQKCCTNGCGMQCLAPSGEHICPKGTEFHNKCNKCTCSDAREPVSCEQNICSRQKPGYCPSVVLHKDIEAAGCGVRCYTDEDCEGTSRCCNVDGCGQICANTEFERPGICPVAEGNDACGEWCDGDLDCPGEAKCCKTGCGKVCKPAEDPGFCPAQLETPNCFFRDDQCISNRDCSNGQKCCDSPCGRKCTKPVPEKPKLCPNPQKLTLKPGHFCTSDHQCPHDLKCCSNSDGDQGCTQPTEYKTSCRNIKCSKRGYYCVDTEDGPECVDKPRTTCAETVCDEDASCLQKKDKAICVPHTKVGHCPLIATSLRPCKRARVLCETDDDCEGGDICCTAGCVRRCVKPLKTDCASVGNSLCRTAGYVCQDGPSGAVCVEDLYTCDHKRCPAGYTCHESFTGARCVKERESCDTKICSPDEDCYEEEDGAICIQAYISEASIERDRH